MALRTVASAHAATICEGEKRRKNSKEENVDTHCFFLMEMLNNIVNICGVMRSEV